MPLKWEVSFLLIQADAASRLGLIEVLASMPRNNAVPYFALALLASALLYLWIFSGQPRMADGGLSGGEMSLAEKLLSLAVPLSIFAAMFVAMRRAYRAGSWFWFLACLFVWPLTFVYTLFVNRTDAR